MAWQGSTRRDRLPPNWQQLRSVVLERDPTCRLGYPGRCSVLSTQVDHATPGDDHSLANLQGVCAPCHSHKTATERPRRDRKPETHPGCI